MNSRHINRPLIPREKILVGLGHHIDHELSAAHEYDLGVEIQTFASPAVLSKDYSALMEKVIQRTSDITGPIGCHGPFIDTIHYSPDPEIMEVARRRYLQALTNAKALGAKYIIFHSQYNVMIKIVDYPDIYHNQSMLFWPEIIDKAEQLGIDIYLENMFDESPAPICKIIDDLGSPVMGICLDIAHTILHSKMPLEEWINAFLPYLRHVHLSDCKGIYDDHITLGNGVIDLPAALELLRKTGNDLCYTLETGKHTVPSLDFLGIPK